MNTPSYATADLPFVFSPAQIGTLQDIRSKKRCLQNLSRLLFLGLSETEQQRLGEDFSEFDIFDALISREQLGSTGIGDGCAIPHGRLHGISEPKLAILTLSAPLDFDAIDTEPIEIVLGLLVPDNKHGEAQKRHLQILAMLSEFLDNDEHRRFLKKEMAAETIYAVVADSLKEAWTAYLATTLLNTGDQHADRD